MQEAEVRIPSTKEILDKWDGYSKIYSKFISPNFIHLGQQLAHLAGVNTAESILEVACGDGSLSAEICLLKPQGSTFCSTDLSPNMCKFAFSTVSKLADLVQQPMGLINYRQKLIEHNDSFNPNAVEGVQQSAVDLLKWQVMVANNENLDQIQDASVDCYISSLSLQIVENPDKMIKECLRVLKPGGRAAFSVWGLKENSYFFTSMQDEAKKFLPNQPKKRTMWHLNDREKTVQLFKECGFNQIQAFHSFNGVRWFDDQFMDEFIGPFVSVRKYGLEEEQERQLVENIKKNYRRVQDEENMLVGFGVLIIVVQKDDE